MEIQIIKKNVNTIVNTVVDYKIVSEATLVQGVEMLSELNKRSKIIKTEKEKITKPLNLALKEERARWKPIEEKIDSAVDTIRDEMRRYQTEMKRKAQEEEVKIAKRVGEGKGHIKLETAVSKIEKLEKPITNVTTGVGSISFRTDRKCEVQDVTKIPFEYLVPNMVAIRQAMKNGVELTGVRYWNEETPINKVAI